MGWKTGKRARVSEGMGLDCFDPDAVRGFHLSFYGLSQLDYLEMYDGQRGCCLICGESYPPRMLQVDHDHESGEVRGLLCPGCNKGLGQFYDDPERMRAAAAYIEAHRG